MVNTFTESIWNDVKAHTWKYEPRHTPIVGALVHATRSTIPNNPTQREYEACKNWFKSPNNRTVDSQGRVSAGMTHAVVGGGGKFCVVLPDEMYPTWSAGHMDTGGFWSVEIAQATNDTPFDPLDIERAQHEIAKKAKLHVFPVKHIPFMDGDNKQAPGIAYHDASRNGVILGKSDPGKMPPFNNRLAFVAGIQQLLEPEEEDMAAIELVWSYETAQLFVLGQGEPRWVADPAAAADLEKAYGKPQKALSKKALQALGAKV
ncbi:MAG: hypothetical protein M3P06_11510 [Acidobacteriota bacterium]|nr:hypothetical protein [Acidobacteriota bacterium]